MSKTEAVMRAVAYYGEACVNLSRATCDPTDARKRELALWREIQDMLVEFEASGNKCACCGKPIE